MAVVFAGNEVPEWDPASTSGGHRVLSGPEFLRQCFEHTYCLVPAPSVVVRTDAQKTIGGYCSDLPHSGDVEMWMRFAFHGSIGILQAVQAYYRWHGENMGGKYYRQQIEDQREFWKACKYAVNRSGNGLPQIAQWMESMSAKLGQEGLWVASRAFDAGNRLKCDLWLEFVEEVYPDIRSSWEWRRLWAKRRLGERLWQIVRPTLDKVRGIDPQSVNAAEQEPFRVGEEVGWWPE